MAGLPLPMTLCGCIARVPLPTAHRRCGGALQEFHRPPPTGGVEVRCKSSTALRPQAVWRCIAGVLLPAAHRQCGSEW